MIAAFNEIDRGSLSLDEQIVINHKFTLDPTSEISKRPENSYTNTSELLNCMILASCNESTNMLADRIGIKRINETMEKLGCKKTRLSHLLYSGAPLLDPGIDGTSSNTTTPNEITRLMKLIYTKEVASERSCLNMISILENGPEIRYKERNVNGYFRLGLPKETTIGSKVGLLANDIMETAAINHDYILTIMSNNTKKEFIGLSVMLMSHISRILFDIYHKK